MILHKVCLHQALRAYHKQFGREVFEIISLASFCRKDIVGNF